MTSFVREILSASGKLGEKEDLATKTGRLKKQMEEKKAEIRKEMEGKYLGFLSSFNETSTLVSQLEAAVEEVEAHRNTINHHLKPELAEGRREMTELLRQLQELSATVEVANRIKKVYRDMEDASNLLDEKRYLEASRKLREVHLLISNDDQNLETCDEDQVKAFEAAKVEYIVAQEKIHYTLGKEWDALFQVEETKEEEAGKRSSQKIVVNFGSTTESEEGQQQKAELLSQLLQAMKMADMLDYRVSKFSHKLFTGLLSPVIEHQASVAVAHSSISVTYENGDSSPQPHKVFGDLSLIFDLLQRELSAVIHDEADEGQTTTLFSLVGRCCSDKFIQCLVKKCLAPAVPSVKQELPHFETILEQAKELQKRLIVTEFVPDGNFEIMKYAENIDETFASKRVATILGAARDLIKEDLHLTRPVDETSPYSDDAFEGAIKEKLGREIKIRNLPELEDLNLPDGFSFDDCIFRFPRCQVSQHVFKIMNMVHSTLEEACTSSNAHLSGRLIYASRIIFELYRDVMPIYHREALRQFPQHSALAFTNCMYLAHQCSTLGYEYKSRLPAPLSEQFLTFADMIVKVRVVGIELFQEQLRQQQEELGTILKESGFSQLQGEAQQLPPKTEKSLKQMLLQMNRLKNVWQTVLPSHVYGKSIGVLLNYIVGELIQRVVKLEDIAAESAVQLSTLFSFVEEKAPEIFVIDGDSRSSKHDVVRYVRLWQKFKELILVLNANLREIEDRWASGKGPLAVEFTVEEMKQLIRALFQNTDRRALVLAKIKFES